MKKPKKLDLNSIYKSVKSDLNEDALMDCDGGGDAGGGDGMVADAPGDTAAEILGNHDHKKDGYLGPGCFHIPSNILKKKEIPGKKSKKTKNPYLSRMTMVSETELTAEILNEIGQMNESDLMKFVNSSYEFFSVDGMGNHQVVKVDSIAYSDTDNVFWIKCIFETNEVMFAAASFNSKTHEFVPVSKTLISSDEVQTQYRHAFSSMNMFMIWKDGPQW